MKARVDQMRCATVGICVKVCPQVFRFEPGSKKATVIVDDIPPALEPKCREVAARCPSKAVIIEE